jgi:uridine kinase
MLLRPLGPGGDRVHVTRVFDMQADRAIHVSPRTASRDAVLLLEGVFLLRPELREQFDYTVFLDAPFDVCLTRALARDTQATGDDAAAIRARYASRYWPAQRLYFAEVGPRELADLVIDHADPLAPSIARERSRR